jgi:hypothetical protein
MTRGIQMQMNQQKQNLVIDKNKLVVRKKIIIPTSKTNQPSYQHYSQLKNNQFLRFNKEFYGYFR